MQPMVYLFRAAFVVAVIVGTHLATTGTMPSGMVTFHDKLEHAGGFLVLSFLLDQSLPQVRSFWSRIALPLLAYGAAIEIVQHYLPYRTFDLLDLLADAVGIAGYWLMRPTLGRIPFLPRRRTT